MFQLESIIYYTLAGLGLITIMIGLTAILFYGHKKSLEIVGSGSALLSEVLLTVFVEEVTDLKNCLAILGG